MRARWHRDVLFYSRTSKETGFEKGEYARVESVDAPNNLLTVIRADGSEQTYGLLLEDGSFCVSETNAFSMLIRESTARLE